MMQKKMWLGVVASLLLVACSNNSTTAGLRIDGESQTVIFGDNVMGSRLLIDNIATLPIDDRVRGIVQLSSAYKGDQHIQYRFYWYDDNGLEVNPRPSAWKQTVIRGFESRTLSEVSVHPNGTQFRIQIRPADN
ncbi:YcfL family protein [Vibrio ulleungensis]|jgi:uncharacterized protein YcfL|nr:YcfL family protein [Vibrio ulleungensis]